MDLFTIKGKVAVVTGGTRGLGKSIALGLAKAGAKVAVIGRTIPEEVLAALNETGSECRGYAFDLADCDGYDGLVADIVRDFGTVDILVNNAGVQKRHPSVQFPKDDWDFVMRVNLDAVFLLCQKFGAIMLEKGRGKIINMASLLSFQGGLTVPAYAASKSAVMGLTRALSNEWAAKGVGVNAIAPGYMATEMNSALMADQTRSRQILERIPAGRWGSGEDMIGAVIFLASAASDYVSGFTLAVDGGWLGR